MSNKSPKSPPAKAFSRADLLKHWLSASPATVSPKFSTTVLVEVAASRPAATKPLSETIFVHHSDPATARKKLTRLGYSRVADALDRRPKAQKTRLANFGEVVASEFLRQLRGYQIPVYRLRYNSNDESSPKGDDVLAFEFADKVAGAKDTVIVAEVKVRSEFKSEAVEEAHDALRKGHRPRPKSFAFVVDILYGEKRDAEAEKVLDLLNKFGKKSLLKRSCLFLVTAKKPTDAFGCITGKRQISNLEAVQFTVPDLSTFVNELFDAEIDVNAL